MCNIMAKRTSTSHISYRETLLGDVRKRYDEKISKIHVDPYVLGSEEFSADRETWPEISYVDVLHFLVFQESAYSKEQLKNYKSMDAYKLFQDGWVRQILHKEINGIHLIRSKVAHSMRIREKPLEPWVIVNGDGIIDSAHCTCMAGLGECCNHVAALLFALETSTRIKKDATVTDAPAYWMLPSNADLSSPYKRISEMHLESAVKKRNMSTGEKDVVESSCKNKSNNISSPTKHEETLFFHNLAGMIPNAAVLSLADQFSDNFVAKSLSAEWPVDLGALYDSQISDTEFSYDQILDKCKVVDISITKNQALFVEQETRNQSKSVFWHNNRVGRITASHFHSSCHTNVSKPSVCLLKTICCGDRTKKAFSCAATDWGQKKEKTAKKEYLRHMEMMHKNFKVTQCGLILNECYPQFGASPDGFIDCECCGGGCLEIKCPFSMKDKLKLEIPWLIPENGSVQLNRSHSYYYQLQMQLFMTGRQYCDFFVWCPQNFHLERVFPDKDLWDTMSVKALEFHTKCIMPELVCKFFSRKHQLTPKRIAEPNLVDIVRYCICGGVDDGRRMILCENESCSKKWFHLQCIRMKRVPKGAWFCVDCQS